MAACDDGSRCGRTWRIGVFRDQRRAGHVRYSGAAFRNPTDALAGTVERVTFHNSGSGFCVLKVQARGKRDQVTVIGHAPVIGAGEWITAIGAWISDRVHGLQFKAEVLTATAPTGADGIEKDLASGQMRGIGPAMAKRIVATFGDS